MLPPHQFVTTTSIAEYKKAHVKNVHLVIVENHYFVMDKFSKQMLRCLSKKYEFPLAGSASNDKTTGKNYTLSICEKID